MKRLLYVPIIHEEADLGSAGPSLAQNSLTQAGERLWALHQETVRGFWEEVERYLRRLDPQTIRVYQDGLAVNGALGRRIVEEGARRGSRNYQLIRTLLDGGAQLRATEDTALLLEEHASLHGSERQRPSARQREDLLARRDAYIAGRVNSTLREGESGVLFIGAVHDVIPHLATDIDVQQVKDATKARRFIQELLLGTDSAALAALAHYVAAPIEE
jgi:hypothetical protein